LRLLWRIWTGSMMHDWRSRPGLVLDPTFTVSRFRKGALSSNPTYLALRERIHEGMHKAGVPEG
jgi:hypothetical protein